MPRRALLLATAALLACSPRDDGLIHGPEYVASVDEWHAGRIERLQRPDGWLTLVGLHSLDPGPNPFGRAADNRVVLDGDVPAHAGVLHVEEGGVRLEVFEGVELKIGDTFVREAPLRSDANGAPTQMQLGTLQFYVIERNGAPMLRVKDAASDVLAHFEGIERWSVDERWRVVGRFEPYDPPRSIRVPNVLGYDETVECHGAVVFELEGETYRLEPLSPPDDDLFLVFGDRTNGVESYGGGRFLYCDPPDAQGRVVIDFNRAYNPPCVFTAFATCPLPTREGTLDVAVTAGEKMWGDAH